MSTGAFIIAATPYVLHYGPLRPLCVDNEH